MALPIIGAIGEIAGSIFGIGKEIVHGIVERKKIRLENETAIARAVAQNKIQLIRDRQSADIAWENTALQNSGIKDEVVMFIILAPMVGCFIPGGAQYVKEGFLAMREALPSYWEWAFVATIGVAYGIRNIKDFLAFKKGDL